MRIPLNEEHDIVKAKLKVPPTYMIPVFIGVGYAEKLGVGTKLVIEGRIQSREYKKKLEDGTAEMRKAFEVSVVKLEEAETEEF